VLLDLLMAVMDSLATWSAAAGDEERGRRWRDAATAGMIAASRYVPYEDVVRRAAVETGLLPSATDALIDRWDAMEPWPDAANLGKAIVPFGLVTNCSQGLARVAVGRSGARPRFVLSAEEAGWYKPHPLIYHEACRRLGTSPARTAFIAGSPFDADGAASAGLPAWFVRRRPEHTPQRADVRIIRSLAEVGLIFGSGRSGT
jgi:2-haloacid dehalogenase